MVRRDLAAAFELGCWPGRLARFQFFDDRAVGRVSPSQASARWRSVLIICLARWRALRVRRCARAPGP